MIHVIPHHIKRGSWLPWYDMIHFEQEVNYLNSTNIEEIEKGNDSDDYSSNLKSFLNKLPIKKGDIVFIDIKYTSTSDSFEELFTKMKSLSQEYQCKFVIVDDDNRYEFNDNEYFTIFSNRFNILNSKLNFNYFRYRSVNYDWFKGAGPLLEPFIYNLRQKKINFICGGDKIERLLSLKHIYDIGLNEDAYIGYSGFMQKYDDSEISNSLIKFRDSTLPLILDIPFEQSMCGAVNVEIPPLPINLNSYISCISETSIIDGPPTTIHVSEKTWNPFISHNIPLFLGSSGLYPYLRDLGFWLAEDLFDTKTKTDYHGIVEQFKSNLSLINSMSIDEIHNYFITNQDKIKRNYILLSNQKFIYNSENYKLL